VEGVAEAGALALGEIVVSHSRPFDRWDSAVSDLFKPTAPAAISQASGEFAIRGPVRIGRP
jgi:hypothetical protein